MQQLALVVALITAYSIILSWQLTSESQERTDAYLFMFAIRF